MTIFRLVVISEKVLPSAQSKMVFKMAFIGLIVTGFATALPSLPLETTNLKVI